MHCHMHMYGAWASMHGDRARAFVHGFGGPPAVGFGVLEMTGIFLLASLAFGLLMWMTLPRQPAREGVASAFLERRQEGGEYSSEASHEMWSSPPEIAQEISYEQPQADYPRMYYERPSREEYPDT
jgi:hypothetical protein